MGNNNEIRKANALNYFRKDPLFHLDMSEPIKREKAMILFADEEEGVLLKEVNSGAYLLSALNEEVGK